MVALAAVGRINAGARLIEYPAIMHRLAGSYWCFVTTFRRGPTQ
jgi:hypothetical protein